MLMDTGRVVTDESNGEILSYAGPKQFDDYLVRGDTAALDALWSAVS